MSAALDSPVVVTVTAVALAVVLGHFVRQIPLRGWDPLRAHWALQAASGLIMLAVALITGLVVLDRAPASLGLTLGQPSEAALWWLIPLVVLVPGTFLASRGAAFANDYPEAPVKAWTRARWWTNAATWAVYLAGYELLFRGLCLAVLVDELGVVPGIAATTALYVLAHLPKSLAESLGSFPMGVVFAQQVLLGQSILLPWTLHCVMALSADTFALVGPRHPRGARGAGR